MAKLKFAFLSGLITIGLAVAAYIEPWYSIETSPANPGDLFPHTKTYFMWKNATTDRIDKPSDSNYPISKSYSDLKLPTVQQTFDSCLSFLTIGLAIAVVLVVGQLIALCMVKGKMNRMFKWVLVLTSLVVTAMLCVSFFTLMNLPPAFSKDKACQNSNGGNNNNGGNLWCSTFRGDQTLSGTDTVLFLGQSVEYIWTPSIGWWCCLGAIVGSLIAAAGTFATHR